MAKIQVEHLTKSYRSLSGDDHRLLVLNDINLTIAEGELVTFFGPNGCGKTTLLKVLAGVEPFDTGRVSIDEKGPEEARTALIFQNYSDSLMPWLTARRNILFPYTLKKRKGQIHEAQRKMMSLLSELRIELPLGNYPYQLSGGQQQLVAILRTLIYSPDVILMDEPFSSLDYQTRSFMQRVLLEIWEREKATILFISHDLEEAIFLADRLVLLGRLPATIREVKTMPFGRPRSRELFQTDEFFAIKKACLQVVQKEV